MRRSRKRKSVEINPDEILIDSQNPSEFDTDRFEGRMERPLGRRSFLGVAVLLGIVLLAFVGRAGQLQIAQGATYAQEAKDNQLEEKVIVADRGEIVDRNNT